MTHTHCFSSFVDCYFLREKRLVFDRALPDSPPASTSGRGDEIVGEIMTAISKIKADLEPNDEDLQKLKEQVMLKLQELKGVIIDSSKLNEVMKALNANAEKINEAVRPAIDALKGVTQEVIQFRGRIEGLLKGGEKPEDALLGEGKFGFEALRKSLGSFGKYVPEAIGGFFHSMGDSTILRMVQRGFFTFMANLDQSKIVPGFLKPFLKNQVEGAKQSLLRLDAEDGMREAVEMQAKVGKNFQIVWDDTVWETKWLPTLEKQDASKRSDFVKREVLQYLGSQSAISGTKLYIDMKDIPVEKTAVAPRSAGAAAHAQLEKYSLSVEIIPNVRNEVSKGSMITFKESGNAMNAHKIAVEELTIWGTDYVVETKNGAGNTLPAQVYFVPVEDGTTLATLSKMVYVYESGGAKDEVEVTLKEIGSLVNENKKKSSGSLVVSFKRK